MIMASDPARHGYLSHYCQTDTNRISVMSIFFYGFNRGTADDFDQLDKSATLFRPKLIVADADVCCQPGNYALFSMVDMFPDMGRLSGLVLAGIKPSPFKYADIVTSVTTGMPLHPTTWRYNILQERSEGDQQTSERGFVRF